MTARKRVRKNESVLDRLAPHEGQEVLRRLLAARPSLRSAAEQLASSLLGEVTCDAIAAEVEAAVQACDLDDLKGRAGRHEWGYVEPTEAAWEILEDAVEPFVSDVERHVSLGLESEALEICKGVVLGLYRVGHGNGDLLEWAQEFPFEAAAEAVETWRAARRPKASSRRSRPAFPYDFLERCAPQWSRILGHPSPRGGDR